MDARRHSLSFALAGGVAVGAVALCARYAPARWTQSVETPASGPSRFPTPTSTSSARSSDDIAAPLPTFPVPRAERFASAPEILRACPSEMTLVDGDFCPELAYTCARRNENAGPRCAEYARGNRCAADPDHRRFCIDRYEWPNRVGENPAVYVDWYEAKTACSDAGKRLCRRSEWILACEGPKRLPYPWGFVRQPSPCNIDRAPIPFDVTAMIKNDTRDGELARLWQADRIGAHPDCVSSFGTYDQSGNVDEWTDDLADDPHSPNPSTLNGGYWGPVRDTCRLTTKTHGPLFKFYQVGFRCCGDTVDGISVPPPRPFIERKGSKKEDDPYADRSKAE